MLKPCFALLASVAAVCCVDVASAQGPAGTLTGVITDAAGAPAAGAFVQMKNADRRLNFMVISQEQGKFAIDRLPPGKYVVQAIGGERQSAPSSPVEVAAGKSSPVDLSLTVARAPALPPAWPGRTPGERGAEAEAAVGGAGPRLAEGAGKAIIEAKCMTCHDAQRIVRSRANEARWQQVLSSISLYAQGSTLAKALTGDESKVLLAYLSTNYAAAPGSARPKPDPLSRHPQALLPQDHVGYMVVQADLSNPRAEPQEIADNHDGNGSFSQR